MSSASLFIPVDADLARERLQAARGVMADAPHHDLPALRMACAVVAVLSDDLTERHEARELEVLLQEQFRETGRGARPSGAAQEGEGQ